MVAALKSGGVTSDNWNTEIGGVAASFLIIRTNSFTNSALFTVHMFFLSGWECGSSWCDRNVGNNIEDFPLDCVNFVLVFLSGRKCWELLYYRVKKKILDLSDD